MASDDGEMFESYTRDYKCRSEPFGQRVTDGQGGQNKNKEGVWAKTSLSYRVTRLQRSCLGGAGRGTHHPCQRAQRGFSLRKRSFSRTLEAPLIHRFNVFIGGRVVVQTEFFLMRLHEPPALKELVIPFCYKIVILLVQNHHFCHKIVILLVKNHHFCYKIVILLVQNHHFRYTIVIFDVKTHSSSPESSISKRLKICS